LSPQTRHVPADLKLTGDLAVRQTAIGKEENVGAKSDLLRRRVLVHQLVEFSPFDLCEMKGRWK
jgi:hypothetical protein